MTVPFLDLGRLHRSIEPELREAVDRVIRSSAFVGGIEVARFEEAFAEAHQASGAVGCGSGTDALALALRAMGVGPGDEVIVPSMTFVATAEAVVHAGASPVVADVDPNTLLLSEDGVAAVRSPRTKAVIPVHLYGHVVDFAVLRRWRDSGLLVLEDAAQAHLASWDDQPVGTIGHAACFSFYPGKNLGAFGDGGAIVSSDLQILDEVRRIRDHGRATKYLHDQVGWCSRLDGLQAAVLHVKLDHLTDWTASRRQIAGRYRDLLGSAYLVPWVDGAVHHLVVVRVSDREGVQRACSESSIATGIHYPVPLSQQPWLASSGSSHTPQAERAATEVLSLPMDPLMSAQDVARVSDTLERALECRSS